MCIMLMKLLEKPRKESILLLSDKKDDLYNK